MTKRRENKPPLKSETISVDQNGCWITALKPLPAGYVQLSKGHKLYLAHRVFYERHRGPIPPGLTLDHLCRNRACVNPEHLEAVTLRANLMRGKTAAAANASKTVCLNGHRFDEPNTQFGKQGPLRKQNLRRCRACCRDRARKYKAAKKSAPRTEMGA